MAVYYKFKSEKEYDSIPVDGRFISVGSLKAKITELRRLGGTDCDLRVTNAYKNYEYTSDVTLIRIHTSVLVRRVPGCRRETIYIAPVSQKEELNVGHYSGDVQVADKSSMKSDEDSEWIEFGNDQHYVPPIRDSRAWKPLPSGHGQALLPSGAASVLKPTECHFKIKTAGMPSTQSIRDLYMQNFLKEIIDVERSIKPAAEMLWQTAPDLAPENYMQPQPIVSREGFEACKPDLKRKRDFQRCVEMVSGLFHDETEEVWSPTWKNVEECPQYMFGLINPYSDKLELEKYDDIDDSEYPLVNFGYLSKDEHIKFKRYVKQVRESRGYDVDCFPPALIGAPFRPRNFYWLMIDECQRQHLIKQMEFIVGKMNAEAKMFGKWYKPHGILNVVIASRKLTLLTLLVKEVSSGVVKIVQAMIYDVIYDTFVLIEWRFKPQDTPQVFKYFGIIEDPI